MTTIINSETFLKLKVAIKWINRLIIYQENAGEQRKNFR